MYWNGASRQLEPTVARCVVNAGRRRVTALIMLATLAPLGLAYGQEERIYGDDPKDFQTLSPPKVVKRVQPQYDESARADKVEGHVSVRTVISKEGKPRDITVVESLDPRLDPKAIAAAKQWEFEPARLNGKPVLCRVVLELYFRLDAQPKGSH